MARWLKINGVDYNLDVVGTLSLEDFRKEGKHGFAKGVNEDDLKATLKQLKAVHGMSESEVNKLVKKEESVVKGGAPIVRLGEVAPVDAKEPAETLVYTGVPNKIDEIVNTSTNAGAGAGVQGKGTKPSGRGTSGK